SAAYSPFRHEIVYTMDQGGNERYQLFLLTGTGPAEHSLGDGWVSENLTGSPNVQHGLGASDRAGQKPAFTPPPPGCTRFDLYVLEREGKVASEIVQGPGGYFDPTNWSRDGRFLLALHSMSSANHNIYEVDTAAKNQMRILTKHEGEVRYEDPFYSED